MKKVVSAIVLICMLVTCSIGVFADPPPTSLYQSPNGGMMTSVTRSITTDPDGPGVELTKVAFLTTDQAKAYYYAMTHITWASQVKSYAIAGAEGTAATMIASAVGITNPVASTCIGLVVTIVSMSIQQQDQINFQAAHNGTNPVIVRYYYSYNLITGAFTGKFKEYSTWSGYPWSESPYGYRGTQPVPFTSTNTAN